MNTDAQFEKDLQDALIAWQEGSEGIPEERATGLLQRIQDDGPFRQALAKKVWTLSVARVAQSAEPRWMALNEALGLDAPSSDEASIDAGLDQELLHSMQQNPAPYARRQVAGWYWLGLAAAVTITALAASWFTSGGRPAFEARRAPHLPLAVLVHADAAQGGGVLAARPETGQNLNAGPLSLRSGKVSLMFNSGVVLHLEGPAELDLLTVDRVFCRTGRVHLRVPKGAEGFCIETPGGAVTDLGTELGVSVGTDGNTQVAVFEGEAEASVRLPGQEGVRTELLTAQQSAKLVPATGEILTTDPNPNPEGFLTASELQVPALRLASGYEESIQTARPVHYWKMDRVEQGLIPNEVAGAPGLLMAGGARVEPGPPESPEGRAVVHFGGKVNPGALYAAEPWQAPGAAHAIEMWFASTTTDQMDLIAFTTGKAPNDHLELVELAVRRPGRSPRPGTVRYLTRWPAGSGGGINIYTEPKFLPYQWHHLVAQQANGKMELYIDGTLVGKADADPFAPTIPCDIQLGCLRFKEGWRLDLIQRPFAGKLAQVAIYDRLLTPEEMRARASSRLD